MKINELLEAKASPNFLIQKARNIPAKVGIEFELVVPNAIKKIKGGSDFSHDEETVCLENIESFFEGKNTRYDMTRLIKAIKEAISSKASHMAEKEWNKVKKKKINRYIIDNDSSDEERYQLEDEEGDTYQNIRDEFINEYSEELDQNEILQEIGFTRMIDVYNHYEINWPYHNEGRDSVDFDKVQDMLQDVIGGNIKVLTNYHDDIKNNTSWYIEPDTSIEPDDEETDAGIEIVSPILSFDQMVTSIDKIRKWAHINDCYTNKSTGLHINVSLPNFNSNNLDYIKLALLLGDAYILKQFGRSSNEMCQSSFDRIRKILNRKPDMAISLMKELHNKLNSNNYKTIQGKLRSENKYQSIHVHDNRIEFRSPGGDWLEEDMNVIIATMARFIVALNAACHPKEQAQEYATKLTKFLESIVNREYWDMVKLFSAYSVGQDALKVKLQTMHKPTKPLPLP